MIGSQTVTEVAVAGTRKSADAMAARMQREAFNWQRYSVEDGIRPGTFSVVLVDADTVRPVDRRQGMRDDLRGRVSMRTLMRSETAKTPTHKLIG
jgi:hypothetical protein